MEYREVGTWALVHCHAVTVDKNLAQNAPFLFALWPLCLSVVSLVWWLEAMAREQRWQGLLPNHHFRVLPLVHLHWPTWGWSLGLERSFKSISFPLPSSCYDFPQLLWIFAAMVLFRPVAFVQSHLWLEVKSRLYGTDTKTWSLAGTGLSYSPSRASLRSVTHHQNSGGWQKNWAHNRSITTW